MNTRWVVAAAVVIGLAGAFFLAHARPGYFASLTYLGGLLFLQILLASLWHFRTTFFFLLMGAFFLAGMHVPMQGAGTVGRWLVLAVGAGAGYLLWMQATQKHFGLFHLIALFCVLSALVSASVSLFPEMAFRKSSSLLLLFLFAATGARVCALGREEKFIESMVLAAELLTAFFSVCYFLAGFPVLGNPNSLGAVAGVICVPLLFWSALTGSPGMVRARRTTLLALALALLLFSQARAAILGTLVAVFFVSFVLRQHRLLMKMTLVVAISIGAFGMVAPDRLLELARSVEDKLVYKGHEAEGLIGSRAGPWRQTMNSIRENPWFGTGFGTSPSGEDPGLYFGRFSSSTETKREHGTSYLQLIEWMGLLGILPFLGLLIYLAASTWRALLWLRHSGQIKHPAVPLILILIAGAVHAGFEDWLLAVGYYLCVFYWSIAFIFIDLAPGAAGASVAPEPSLQYVPGPFSPSGFPSP
jgi:O-antigen ligase